MSSLICLLLLATALSQESLSKPNAPQWVKFLGATAVTVTASKPQPITLRFQIDLDKHINSSQPHSELLIPTKIRFLPPTDVGIGKIVYPPGEEKTFPFSGEDKMSVYSGAFAVRATVSSVRTATPGQYRVHGEMQYQACNDRACFPPMKLPVEFDMRVTRNNLPDPNAKKQKNPAQSPHVHPTYPKSRTQ